MNTPNGQGTLHRDVKPSNLLIDADGTVWVADFGLAKALDQDGVTQTAGVVGTLRYMAPEQFAGNAEARSDVYSLGLTLYELATLRPAFAETSRTTLIDAIMRGVPKASRRLCHDIPRDLETIILKSIAREPAARYASAGTLAAAAEAQLQEARTLQAALTQRFPDMPIHQVFVAVIEGGWGRILGDCGRWDEARSHFEAAIAALDGLPEDWPRPPYVRGTFVAIYTGLARAHGPLGNPKEAAEAARQAERYRPEP